jgi:hypothetical protein
MASYFSSPWNAAIPCLHFSRGNDVTTIASGFFWELGGRVMLVSNWHCFAGIDPDTGRTIDPHGRTPNLVTLMAFRNKSEPDAAGNFAVGLERVEIALGAASSTRWLEHPMLGRKVDVAAIDVTDELTAKKTSHACVNTLEADGYATPAVSEAVFIIGYPLGMLDKTPIPVWKRGTIATDPTFDAGGLPMLYVDTATRPGMSGSIVLVRMSAAKGWTTKDGTKQVGFGERDQILGIYSGALGAHQVEAQLGVVWKRQVIEETIAGQARAKI